MVRPPRSPQTLAIDHEIVRLAGCRHPRVLFVPTASGDDAAYCRSFRDLYATRLGCRVSELLLYRDRPSRKAMRAALLGSDIIYVGGGNTLRMMKIWRRLGIDRWLDQARRQGTVLAGLSAGALCWFRQGNSDSRKFSDAGNRTLIRVSGLNYIDALVCPHYDVERHRQPALKAMMRTTPGIAVALENCTAIEIVDDQYRILRSNDRRNAWRVYWYRGEYHRDKLDSGPRYRPLRELLDKSA